MERQVDLSIKCKRPLNNEERRILQQTMKLVFQRLQLDATIEYKFFDGGK